MGIAAGTINEFIPLYQNQLARVPRARLDRLQPATRWLVENGRQVSHALARRIFLELSRRVHAWVGDADVVITPTVVGPPPGGGAWAQLDGEAAFRAAAVYGAFTAVLNLSGQPAASVPVGLSPEGFSDRGPGRRTRVAGRCRAGAVAWARGGVPRAVTVAPGVGAKDMS